MAVLTPRLSGWTRAPIDSKIDLKGDPIFEIKIPKKVPWHQKDFIQSNYTAYREQFDPPHGTILLFHELSDANVKTYFRVS